MDFCIGTFDDFDEIYEWQCFRHLVLSEDYEFYTLKSKDEIVAYAIFDFNCFSNQFAHKIPVELAYFDVKYKRQGLGKKLFKHIVKIYPEFAFSTRGESNEFFYKMGALFLNENTSESIPMCYIHKPTLEKFVLSSTFYTGSQKHSEKLWKFNKRNSHFKEE